MKARRAEAVAAYAFLTPFLALLAVFFVYAAGRAAYLSFTDYDLFSWPPNFVGFGNYSDLLQDTVFLTALRNTVLFSLVVTATQTAGALVMASVLNSKIRGISFFRASYYIPAIASSVVITLIFMWLFQRRGTVNFILGQVAAHLPHILLLVVLAALLQGAQVAWERARGLPAGWFDPALLVVSLLMALAGTVLADFLGLIRAAAAANVDISWFQTSRAVPDGFPFWLQAPLPLVTIMMMNVFTTIPTFMLMYLAALQDVPRSQYEAASLDGANPFQQLRWITVPAVQPVTFLVVTLSLIGTLKVFDQVAILGDAAPFRSRVTLAYYVYDRMFPGGQAPEVGFAAASAMFLALLTLLVVLLQRRFLRAEGA
ncbi:MAG: sugar ABC transporter permease [Trueperaceae bacterium]